MQEDNIFWFYIWSSIFALIILLAMIITIYNVEQNREFIEYSKGRDPILAHCAWYGNNSGNMCITYVGGKK